MKQKQEDEAQIQSVEVKDQFGTKYQKYFKTMILEGDTPNTHVPTNKVVKCAKDGTVKLDQLGDNIQGFVVGDDYLE